MKCIGHKDCPNHDTDICGEDRGCYIPKPDLKMKAKGWATIIALALGTIGLFLVLAFCCGCQHLPDWIWDKGNEHLTNNLPIDPIPPYDPSTNTVMPPPAGVYADEIPLEDIVWLHPSIADWEKTTHLNVRVDRSFVHLDRDTSLDWPRFKVKQGGKWIDANAWVFIERDGQWYGVVFDYMAVNQVAKGKHDVCGKKFKKPAHFPADWKPTAGEEYGWCVSGNVRMAGVPQVRERGPIRKAVWR
jgi:hypothetical protein